MDISKAIVRSFILLTALTILLAAWRSGHSQTDRGNGMITIPAGSFIMGSNNGPEDERPAHRVELPEFTIDRTPITNARFAAFLNAVGPINSKGERLFDADDNDARIHRRDERWSADPDFEDHPVVEVSWSGGRDYCVWMGKRLPTEAEWEKAARGSDRRKYPWGNSSPNRTRAQFNAGWNETAPVGSLPKGASLYGVFDLAGNVWEWVNSAYLSYPYNPADGREDLEAGPIRGTRGGGHDSPSEELTTTQRGRNLSRNFRSGHHNIGFRCAR